MTLKSYKLYAAIVSIGLGVLLFAAQSCKVSYGFHDAKSIPDSLKFVKINQFENKATYVNPTLAPALTEKLQQKVTSQTRLRLTNSTDVADPKDAIWIIDCKVTGYSFSTSGISNQQVNTNRLTVSVHIDVRDGRTQKIINKYDVSTPFDYSGTLSLQQAEQNLQTQMLRDIPDAIFNRIFSNW